MATVSITDARKQFEALVDRVEAGETIVITKWGKPVAELRPVSEKPKERVPGIDKGKVFIHEDWDEPLPEFEEYM